MVWAGGRPVAVVNRVKVMLASYLLIHSFLRRLCRLLLLHALDVISSRVVVVVVVVVKFCFFYFSLRIAFNIWFFISFYYATTTTYCTAIQLNSTPLNCSLSRP